MSFSRLAKLARIANLKVSVAANGSSAQVTMPSLAFDDIDRTGNINIWRIQKMMTAARLVAYNIPSDDTGNTFLEYDKFSSNFYTFMASTETEVSREFYDLLDEPEWPGVDISFYLGYLGSASLNTVATLTHPKTKKELAWNTNTVVCVDKTTRKPSAIPDWWREKYQDAVIGNKKLLIKPFEAPAEASVYQVKIPWCDVDGYKHANYLAYVRYCLDSAMDAINNGSYSMFEGDIFNYHVKKMQVLFIGESLGGDILNVSSWENGDDPYTLHFDMKRGEKTVFQSTMEFFKS